MPTLARWWLKTALGCLVAALALGAVRAADGLVALPPALRAAAPAYYHLLFAGWATQMIFGVAYWMFPRASKEQPRGSDALGWCAYAAWNLGLLGRIVAEPVVAVAPGGAVGAVLVVAAVVQWAGGACFVANTWRRVR